MNEECKYCKTASTCLEMADYGSIYCQLHKRIPRVIDKTYEELQQENQELKKQLHESSLEIQHLIEQDIECPSNCSKLKELNKSLKASRRVSKHHLNRELDLENQQKEFIEYLEDKLNMCDGFLDTIKSDLEEISYAGRASGKTYIATQIMKNEIAMKCYEEVLSKYKEIIGVKDE